MKCKECGKVIHASREQFEQNEHCDACWSKMIDNFN